MSRSSRHQRFGTWLALVAMLALVLMPVMSRALASQAGGKSWIEICSAQGSRWVALNDVAPASAIDGDSVPDDGLSLTGSLDHCSYCSLSQTTPGLPAVPQVLVLPLRHAQLPPLFFQAPRRLHVWSTAQSRAPPTRA